VLVHCSAGIGRTGTYIAILLMIESIAYQKNLGIESGPKISVFGTVRRLREQRGHMVKKLSQYQFIYSYLSHWFKNDRNPEEFQINTAPSEQTL